MYILLLDTCMTWVIAAW